MSDRYSYKLSPMQQGMLFHHLKAEQSGVDIEQVLCHLHHDLNVAVFQQAWDLVIERHTTLRTSFGWSETGEPLQTVHPQVNILIELQDWRNLSESDRTQSLATYLQSDRQRGFILAEPPLMRLALFQQGEADYQLIWTFHHILLDSHAIATVLKEVFTFYEALSQKQELQLAAPHPYQDYIEWLQQQDLSPAETYWKQTLKGFSTPTPLIVDRPSVRDSIQAKRITEIIRLSPSLTCSLKALSPTHKITLNTLVLGIWALLLSRYSGEEEVLFGYTRTCREGTLKGADTIVGFLSNSLPLRVNVSPEKNIKIWLQELQNQWEKLQDYEHTPLIEAIAWSDISSGTSLFESLVTFENEPINSLLQGQGGDWVKREFQLLEQTNFPLNLYGYGGEELSLKIEADAQRFDGDTIARMLGHLKTLLENIAANLDRPLKELQLLTVAEQEQLCQWNQTKTEHTNYCVHQLFEEQVERTPDAIAITFPSQSPDSYLTYQQLNERANQLADYLQELGIGPDILVAVCLERSLEMAIAILGILKAGGAYVPIDPAYPPERLTFMLTDTQAPVILTQSQLVDNLPSHQAKTICLDTDWSTLSQKSKTNPINRANPHNLTYVIYTSGSTGKPKGVALEHRGLVNLILWQIQNSGLSVQAKTLQFASLSFDVSFQEIFSTLCAGGTLVFITEELRRDAGKLLGFLMAQSVERLFLPFIALQHLAEAAQTYELVPTTLREIVTAGEQLQISPAISHLFSQLKNATLHNHYGPSESHVVTAFTLTGSPSNWPALPSIGRPISNTQMYVLDRYLQKVPVGIPGELYIGGVNLARGYLHRPDLTDEKFITNPFLEELESKDFNSRLYKTGDLARYLPDGNIEYLGRIDNQVKVRGFRIELGEIETALATHPAVKEVVVTAREDEPGNKRLVAYLVLNTEQQIAISDWRKFLLERLPDYMIPSIFITLDRLPQTPSGKIDRRSLPAPDTQRPHLEQSYAAPQNQWESILANIWCKLLKFEQVGIDDNFFELGGNSLLSLQVVAKVRQELNIDLPVVKVFQYPTISDLAKYLSSQGKNEVSASEQFQERGDKQKSAMARFRPTRK
ncbi:amino acid adenylation domain-containing protein [Kamptonema sp. UHCC 0994]|uniref:non-ribosomal peptide synthetase n=1 Tax=Kamptonema sp. UHCC 0994 TaxID=3031329 RepID=UPI0023B909E4|nr:amino acid adenylation domain-containing protein [Kamptonema sp. UHCC 0994]MDF0555269.1 amino acid adenylation domain-containing protein [Kamptonema sp. UHCC 0994]